MKEQKSKKNLLAAAVSLALLIGTGVLAKLLGVVETVTDLSKLSVFSMDTVVRAALAALLVTAAANLIIFVLNFPRAKGGRKGTLATVFISLTKYGGVLLGGKGRNTFTSIWTATSSAKATKRPPPSAIAATRWCRLRPVRCM